MAALTSTGSSLRFTTFTFEQRDGELAWLSGTGVAANVRYYSKLEGGGIAAVPEPGEWALMLIGLCFLFMWPLNRLRSYPE